MDERWIQLPLPGFAPEEEWVQLPLPLEDQMPDQMPLEDQNDERR